MDGWFLTSVDPMSKGQIALEPDILNVLGQTPQDLALVCPLTICLLSTLHRTSVLFTLDKSEMFTFRQTCDLSIIQYLAGNHIS